MAGLILDSIFPDKDLASSFDAMLHNTANPTILRSGLKVNQVPGEATLQVDGRLLPGKTGADLVEEIQDLIGPGYSITIDREMPAVDGDPDDPMADRIRDVLARHDPDGIPIPTMIPGFTDAKAYDRLDEVGLLVCPSSSRGEVRSDVSRPQRTHPRRRFSLWGQGVL